LWYLYFSYQEITTKHTFLQIKFNDVCDVCRDDDISYLTVARNYLADVCGACGVKVHYFVGFFLSLHILLHADN
jgi:hypothetical protein